ncbi:MAG: hypothetical protein ABIP97_07350 [Chthoniobacterales bacterium]
MKYGIYLSLVMVIFGTALQASPLNVAPDFTWLDPSHKPQSLKSLQGKPVVILIAPNPKDRHFRAQVGEIQDNYEQLSYMGAIFVAAFTGEPGRIRSNVPYLIASDGPRVGYLYNAPEGTAIAIVGKDGTLEYLTKQVLAGRRVVDVIQNSRVVQEKLRRD